MAKKRRGHPAQAAQSGRRQATRVFTSALQQQWVVPSLTLPVAAGLAVIAEADYVSKQYATLIYLIDSCPFYTHSSGLIVALAHRYPPLARTLFPNPSFPDACVLLAYTPYMRKIMNHESRRILPQLYTLSLPENGGLSLTAKELAERVLAQTSFGAEDEAAKGPKVLPCPVPPPPMPLYPAAVGAVAFAALGLTALGTADPRHWWTALMVGTLVGTAITWLRQRRLAQSAKQYKDLCIVGL